MQDTSVATLNERVAQFVIEYYQGVDPEWLIKKYGFLGMLDWWPGKGIVAINNDGNAVLHKMVHPDPRDLMIVRQDQQMHPDRYPWRTNPKSTLPSTDNPQQV